MKKYVWLPLMIVLTFVFAGCSEKKTDIVGTWERTGDEFAGMQVSVEKLDDGTYRGTITKTVSEKDFAVGLVKWLNVKKISQGKYDYDDATNDGLLHPMTMAFEDSNTIVAHELIKTDVEVGATQTWKRVK